MKVTKQQATATSKILLALLIAFVFTLTFGSLVFAQGPTPTDDEVNRIAKQLFCPVCESTPLDVCPTEACRQWRELIRTMLAEGKSEAEIKQYFVEQYGARVLAEPPNRLVSYLVPAVAILLGVLLLMRGFQMWMKPAPVVDAGSEDVKDQPPCRWCGARGVSADGPRCSGTSAVIAGRSRSSPPCASARSAVPSGCIFSCSSRRTSMRTPCSPSANTSIDICAPPWCSCGTDPIRTAQPTSGPSLPGLVPRTSSSRRTRPN